MAAESLIVTHSDGTTDIQFDKVSQSAYNSRYAYTANTGSAKRFIDVDHKVSPIGSMASDVHTLTLRLEEVDADTARISVFKVSVQITTPKGDAYTATDVSDAISNIMCLFNKNFMVGFSLGQTPSGDYNVTGPFNPDRD
jgi:hypothetical protein